MRSVMNEICNSAATMGVAALVGYGIATAFTIVNPVHGAVFCATSILVSKIVDPIFEEIFDGPAANKASRFVGAAISILVGIGASAAITTLLGFPITFTAGLILTVACIAAVAFTLLATGAVIGLAAYATQRRYDLI